MAVRHAAGIVVAGTEKVRRVGGIVLSLHFGIKEYPDLGIYRLFDIGRIAVPYDARRRKLCKFVERRVYGLPAGMCVVYHAEMGLRVLTGGGKTVYGLVLFVSEHLHVVPSSIMDPVRPDLVVILRSRLESGQPDLYDLIAYRRDPVAAAQDLPGVAQVRFLPYQHISVGKGTDGESNTHRGFRIVLKHRSRYYQFPLPFRNFR